MTDWHVRTAVFDGPLDLLLHLVRREGIALAELQVADVADAYLEYVQRMRLLNLAVAADILVMAATLVHLKSLTLLPRLPTAVEEDEPEDPAEDLLRQLREHAALREAAEALGSRPQLGADTFARPSGPAEDSVVAASVDAFGLLDVYYELMRAGDGPIAYTVTTEAGLGFEACCRYLLETVGATEGRVELGSVLEALPRRSDRVMTFVAALEMARLGLVCLVQAVHLGPVWVTRRGTPTEVDLSRFESWLERSA